MRKNSSKKTSEATEASKHNTLQTKDKKAVTYTYVSEADADMLYMHEKGINSIIQDMYNTLRSDETIDSVLEYLVRKGLPRRSYYRWKAQYPQLEEAHNVFNAIIGARLFKRINHDVKTIHHVMPEYDEHVWKKMVEYHNNLKKDIAVSAAANQKIVADNWSKIMDGEDEK